MMQRAAPKKFVGGYDASIGNLLSEFKLPQSFLNGMAQKSDMDKSTTEMLDKVMLVEHNPWKESDLQDLLARLLLPNATSQTITSERSDLPNSASKRDNFFEENHGEIPASNQNHYLTAFNKRHTSLPSVAYFFHNETATRSNTTATNQQGETTSVSSHTENSLNLHTHLGQFADEPDLFFTGHSPALRSTNAGSAANADCTETEHSHEPHLGSTSTSALPITSSNNTLQPVALTRARSMSAVGPGHNSRQATDPNPEFDECESQLQTERGASARPASAQCHRKALYPRSGPNRKGMGLGACLVAAQGNSMTVKPMCQRPPLSSASVSPLTAARSHVAPPLLIPDTSVLHKPSAELEFALSKAWVENGVCRFLGQINIVPKEDLKGWVLQVIFAEGTYLTSHSNAVLLRQVGLAFEFGCVQANAHLQAGTPCSVSIAGVVSEKSLKQQVASMLLYHAPQLTNGLQAPLSATTQQTGTPHTMHTFHQHGLSSSRTKPLATRPAKQAPFHKVEFLPNTYDKFVYEHQISPRTAVANSKRRASQELSGLPKGMVCGTENIKTTGMGREKETKTRRPTANSKTIKLMSKADREERISAKKSTAKTVANISSPVPCSPGLSDMFGGMCVNPVSPRLPSSSNFRPNQPFGRSISKPEFQNHNLHVENIARSHSQPMNQDMAHPPPSNSFTTRQSLCDPYEAIVAALQSQDDLGEDEAATVHSITVSLSEECRSAGNPPKNSTQFTFRKP